MAREIYHERQKLQFCLLHAIKNLFQQKDSFTRPRLNEIAERLVLDEPNKEKWTPLSVLFKPHHNALTGNYDINVLISALEDKGKSVVWHDRRKGANTIDLDGVADDGLMGILLNVPVTRFAGLWKGRHWVTLRKIYGVWYDLDSDLVAPQAFQDSGKVMAMRAETRVRSSNNVNQTCLFSKRTSSQRVAQNTSRNSMLGMVSARMRPCRNYSASGRSVNDSSSRRSMPYMIAGDCQREEAIEDCIEFFNSSSTFSRATPIATQVSSLTIED